MTIRAITLDLDDTLWPIQPVIRDAETQLRRWLGEQCPDVLLRFDQAGFLKLRAAIATRHPERVHDLSAMRLLTLREALKLSGYDPARAQEAFEVFLHARNSVSFYPEVLGVLNDLSVEFHLASLSNGNADLSKIGIANHFRFSLSAASVGKPKPHPRMFEVACERLELAAHEVLHVGDDLALDAVAARDAGLKSVWLKRDGQKGGHDPEVPTITSLSELRDHIADHHSNT